MNDKYKIELALLRTICWCLHECGIEVSHTLLKTEARKYAKVNQMTYLYALDDMRHDAQAKYLEHKKSK